MLQANLRELQSHAQRVRATIAKLGTTGAQLQAVCLPNRFGNVINIRVGDNYNDLAGGNSRFATNLSGVIGAYFEIWEASTVEKFSLSKAYLHLHASTSPNDDPKELVFLHTEPTSAAATADAKQLRLARWKSGPHLHVKASSHGLGRCHIHLDPCTVPCPALASLSRYRESLEKMIEMLSDELIEYFDLSL